MGKREAIERTIDLNNLIVKIKGHLKKAGLGHGTDLMNRIRAGQTCHIHCPKKTKLSLLTRVAKKIGKIGNGVRVDVEGRNLTISLNV